MHWIQRHILKELAFADKRRYSDLKPDSVEGNLFQYHARDLEKQGLIMRDGEGYALTAKGSAFVADLNTIKPSQHKKAPRLVVMIAAQNEAGEYLLYKWKRHPYRGMVSLPFGRQFSGRGSFETVAEQLMDKTGYEADFTYLGLISLKSDTDHIVAQVFEATNLRGHHGSDELTGKSYWAKPSSVDVMNALMGFNAIITWIEDVARPGLLELDL
jgi:ADP-ribose pyrophosphatase YjhB (NUDIX family)